MSLGHVARVAAGLDQLLQAVNDERVAHLGDALPYLAGSPASADASDEVRASHIQTLVTFVNMAYGGALDSADDVAETAKQAASREPTSVYAPHTVARSVLELLGQSNWLVEAGLPTDERIARILSVRRRDARGAVAWGLSPNRLTEIDEQALTLGLSKTGSGDRRAFMKELPGYGAMVRKLLNDETYSLLSGISHGESWALRNLGYVVTDVPAGSGWGVMVRKEPPAYGMWLAVAVLIRGFTQAVPADFQYRGWSVDGLRPHLVSANRSLDLAVPL